MTAPDLHGSLGVFTQDKLSVLDYTVDWSQWMPMGDSILTAEFVCDTLTLTLQSNTETTATIWISGGGPQTGNVVTCEVSTQLGRTDIQSFMVWITAV